MSLEQTYRKERANLLGFIRSKIADLEDAEDVLQDVFFQAVRHLNVTEPIDNLLGWLYTITRNKIIDWYRKKKNTVSIHETYKDTTIEELLEDSGVSIEKDFTSTLVVETLIETLEELPEAQRQAFIMQAVEGKTFREIAEITGVPVNTLIARKRYAVIFLQKRLSEIKDLIGECR